MATIPIVGKAWQRQIRERIDSSDGDMLGKWWVGIDTDLSLATVSEITYKQAEAVILQYEWLGTMPPKVERCFGMFYGQYLAGALVFAGKAGDNLIGHAKSVIPANSHYLARGACVNWAHPHAASWFIAKVCRELLCVPSGTVMAYSDPSAGEIGTIYQALGWKYLGAGKGGPTSFLVDGKIINAKLLKNEGLKSQSMATVRTAFPHTKSIAPIGRKNRYLGIYGNKQYKKQIEERIKDNVLPYPKRINPTA